MINKISRFTHALWAESVKRLPYIMLILAFLLLWQGYENSKSAENIAKTLVAQSAQRDKDLKSLIRDNAEQTSILCALILKNDLTITKEEAVNLQEICKQRILESTPPPLVVTPTSPKSTTTPKSEASHSSSSSSGSSPQAPTQNTPSTPPSSPPAQDCTFDLLGIHLLCQ